MIDIEIDAQGFRCPLPLLKLKQALSKSEVGSSVKLIASDAGAWRDVPAFIALSPHHISEQTDTDDIYTFVIIKGE